MTRHEHASDAGTAAFCRDQQGRSAIQRYTPNERSTHWITAICFVLVALSGLALFHPALYWLTHLFGGGPWARILHSALGVAMFLAFLGLVIRFWHHKILNGNDGQWMRQMDEVVHNREELLPPVGRYNAGQKLLFWVLLASMLGLLLTGLVMWRSFFSHLFPIGVVRLASLLHAFFGFVIVCAIIVHVYAALWIKGAMKAMTQATVSYAWARKHHAAWHHEVAERERALARDGRAPPA